MVSYSIPVFVSDRGHNIMTSATPSTAALCCQDMQHACTKWHLLQTATANYNYTHTHTHVDGPFSGTTQVSQYQKGKTNLDFTEARDSEWQWHQLGHMQVCISLQTDNHASNPSLKFFTGRMPFLPPNQQCQSADGTSKLQLVGPISTTQIIKWPNATYRPPRPTRRRTKPTQRSRRLVNRACADGTSWKPGTADRL